MSQYHQIGCELQSNHHCSGFSEPNNIRDGAQSPDSRNRCCPPNSLLDIVSDVERAFAENAKNTRFAIMEKEWRDLLLILKESADMILKMADVHRDPLSESFELEYHRLAAISRATTIVARLQVTDEKSDYPMSVVPDESAVQTFPSPLVADSCPMILDPVAACVDQAYYAYKEAEIDVDIESKGVIAFFDNEIETRIRLDRLKTEMAIPFSGENIPSVEFAMMSTPEEMDSLRKTNTMRWLNDVLKWQVIDMNLQANSTRRVDELTQQIIFKKEQIKEVMRRKIVRTVQTKRQELANACLGTVLGSDLFNEKSEKLLASPPTTAPSSPPTQHAGPQMIQAASVNYADAIDGITA